MGRVSIRKTVNFGFLGKEYKECYAVFRAIPVSEYSDLSAKIKDIDNDKAIELVLSLLKSKFVSGKFIDDANKVFDLAGDDLSDFDGESVTKMFSILTGQDIDPKA